MGFVECSTCDNQHAVYSTTAFCPVCGPRPASDKVLEAISAVRDAMSIEDHLDADQRERMRGAGVFERFAVDAIQSVVSPFELFDRASGPSAQSRPPAGWDNVRPRWTGRYPRT